MSEGGSISIVIISLIFSALFSAGESAFLTSNKLYFEIRVNKKKPPFYIRALSNFFDKPSFYLTTTLIGNTVALVVYGIFIARLVEPHIHEYLSHYISNEAPLDMLVLTIQTLISTFIVLLTAEFLPKRIAMLKPENSLKFIGVAIKFIYIITFPIIFLTEYLTNLIINKFVKGSDSGSQTLGLKDLDNYIGNAVTDEGEKLEINHAAFQSTLKFLGTEVGDCLIPRLEIAAIDVEEFEDAEDVSEYLLDAFKNTPHSKLILYREHLDEIIGYCHIRSLLKKNIKLKDTIQEIFYVPETMQASVLLQKFREERKSIAVVVDEFGGTSGIITPEDLAEEVLGEIEDEHDNKSSLPIKVIDSHTFELSARVEIDDLNKEYGKKYGWEIPDIGEYDTLGGFIFSAHGKLPQINEMVHKDNFSFKILDVENAHIKYVRMMIEN